MKITDSFSKTGPNTDRKSIRKKSSTNVCDIRDNGSFSARIPTIENKGKRTLSRELTKERRNSETNQINFPKTRKKSLKIPKNIIDE